MLQAFFYLTLFCYGAALLLYLVWLLHTTEAVGGLARKTLIGAFVMHQGLLVCRYIVYGHFRITSMHDALSVCSLVIIAAYLVFERRYQVTALGSLVTPLVFLMMLGSGVLVPELLPIDPNLQNLWVYSHTLLAFVSYGLFIISGGTAILYLLLSRLLKNKSPGQFSKKLPSLERLDGIGRRCLNIGFPFLTIALVTGSFMAAKQWGSLWSWEPKQVWSLIIWLIYGALLHGRLILGWQGRRAAFLSIIGMVLLMFGFVVINLWFPGLHTFN